MSSRSVAVARVRHVAITRAKRLVLGSPLGPQAHRAAIVLAPAATRRDLKDNEAMKLLVAATLSGDGSAIDIGANVGSVLSEIVRVSPHVRHLAYEPIPILAADLRRRFPTVEVREQAASNEARESSFTHVVSHSGYSGLRARETPELARTETLTVRTTRLDDTLPEGFVPALIKIDVEGAEVVALQGAAQTLERHRPVVAFEHGRGGSPLYGTGPTDLYELLVERVGLRIFDMDGGGPYSREQLVETFELGTFWNFFART
jgi:FkbM family methyltransferase